MNLREAGIARDGRTPPILRAGVNIHLIGLLNLVQVYLCLKEYGKQEQNKSIIGLLSPTEQSLLIDDFVEEYVRRTSLCSWNLAYR